MDTTNVIALISVIVGMSGFFFGIRQYRKGIKIKKAEFLDNNLRRMRENKVITQVIYELQYHLFQYTEEFHKDHKKESMVDETLQFLSYICYLKHARILTEEEFSFFELDIHQALLNFPLRDYLYNLYHREFEQYKCKNDEEGQRRFTYRYLLKYGRGHKLIGDSFYDPNAWKEWGYHHFLNWGKDNLTHEEDDDI